jgi:hypothetical protein
MCIASGLTLEAVWRAWRATLSAPSRRINQR